MINVFGPRVKNLQTHALTMLLRLLPVLIALLAIVVPWMFICEWGGASLVVTSNKCIASSNKCIATSNKKLLETRVGSDYWSWHMVGSRPRTMHPNQVQLVRQQFNNMNSFDPIIIHSLLPESIGSGK